MGETKKIAIITLALVSSLVFVLFNAGYASYSRDSMTVNNEHGTLVVRRGDSDMLRYRYKDVPFKPYVQQLYTPGGINVLRDAPADHLHHHALMFAVAVEGVNFWEEHLQPGRQRHQSLKHYARAGNGARPRMAGFIERLDWINPRTGEVLLKELRKIAVCQVMGATLLTWQSQLEPPPSKRSVTLTGSRYFGMGMRFIKSMDAGGQFLNADGKRGPEGTNGVRSRWCSYTAKAGGEPVMVAIFDHPNNDRHPATWFTMEKPFAYLSATLNLHKKPLEVVSSKPLVLRYGVALWDGRVEADQINELYEHWVKSE